MYRAVSSHPRKVLGERPVQNYYLGIDGGGTNCRARLANQNLETIAETRGGPANTTIGDGSQAYQLLKQYNAAEIAQYKKNASEQLLRVRGALEHD
mgnify:CR=1 FL=1